jgi:hypothetical protein
MTDNGTSGDSPDPSTGVEQAGRRLQSALHSLDRLVGRIVHGGSDEAPDPGGGGCGCLAMVLVAVAVVVAAAVALWGELSSALWDGAPPQDAQTVQVGPTAPISQVGATTPSDLAFANDYSGDGYLIPIAGEWEIYNEAGIATCAGDIAMSAHTQTGHIEVIDDGERIVLREITGDGLGPPIELERTSASETEARYWADLSSMTGVDSFEMELVFSSSSTLGGRMQGCPVRGGRGWLVQPDS